VRLKSLIAALAGAMLSLSAHAYDWNKAVQDALKLASSSSGSPAASGMDALSSGDINAGLKQALTQGAQAAVVQLGKTDGFYGNKALRIPLPASLKKADKMLRLAGMGGQADELILSMNRAAEAAVPQAQALLTESIRSMTLEDAKGLLTGGNTAATEFFRKKTEVQLTESFTPIVKATTDKVGLAQQYNQYAGAAAQFGLVDKSQASIDQYVTRQALDRLYKVIGEQEQAIRAHPMQAGSDLVKKVFGAATK